MQYKIHPAIGIARVGDSPTAFYLCPERPGALPVLCDDEGRPRRHKDGSVKRATSFRDAEGRIQRQAAQFRICAYGPDGQPAAAIDGDASAPDGDALAGEIVIGKTYPFEISSGGTGSQMVHGTVTDVEWSVHLANKKASWYRFQETQGRHGYAPSHPLRNPDVTDAAGRRALIIDPGLQSVWTKDAGGAAPRPRATFARGANPAYPQNFPPRDLLPTPIDTLGEIHATASRQNHPRLLVLGGHGHTGSTSPTPLVTGYANNDGWFDDVSDGPVTATIHFTWKEKVAHGGGKKKTQQKHHGTAEVDVPAWAVVGYPRFAPEIVDMITMDEALYDVFVREFAFAPALFDAPPGSGVTSTPTTETQSDLWRAAARFRTGPQGYYPKFYAEIWPILRRPNVFGATLVFDSFEGADPHNTETGGNLDLHALAAPPRDGHDPGRRRRQFVYSILRKPGQENQRYVDAEHDDWPSQPGEGWRPRAMPELFGNNPLSNLSVEKFLRLTDTQLFLLEQWAHGYFVNECEEWAEGDPICSEDAYAPPTPRPVTTGLELDRGVLGNVVGGAFCPGAELTWATLNPALYVAPYRVRHASYVPGSLSLPKVASGGTDYADLARGLEPGDLTKYLALPWHADFTQCSEQSVDITYEDWNTLYLDSTGDPAETSLAQYVAWWPAHRPIVVSGVTTGQVYWASGIPASDPGMLRMTTGWKDLGFIKYLTAKQATALSKKEGGGEADAGYYQIERNDDALGPPVAPGSFYLGNSKEAEEPS